MLTGALRKARVLQVVIAATGAKKAATVNTVLDVPIEGVENPLPAALVDPLDGIVVWLLDADAAADLDTGDEEMELPGSA